MLRSRRSPHQPAATRDSLHCRSQEPAQTKNKHIKSFQRGCELLKFLLPTSCPLFPLKLYQTILWTCPSTDISFAKITDGFRMAKPNQQYPTRSVTLFRNCVPSFLDTTLLGAPPTRWRHPLSFIHWSLLPVPIFNCWEPARGYVLGPLPFSI